MKKIKCYKFYILLCIVLSMAGCNDVVGYRQKLNSTTVATNNDVYYKVEFSPGANTTKLIVQTIKNANKSINIAAYYFTSKPIADSLILAHANGIDVKVVLDKTQATHKFSSYKKLLAAGIPIRINKKYKCMHNKFMVVDNSIIETGSFNYTLNAEKDNAENVLIIYNNHELVEKYMQVWNRLWNEAE